MNKKEIIIIVCVLLFLALYQFFSKSEIIFPERNKSVKKTIQVRKFIPELPARIKNITHLVLFNARGDTLIKPGTSSDVEISLEVLIPETIFKETQEIINKKNFLSINQGRLEIDLNLRPEEDSILTPTNIILTLPPLTTIDITSLNGNVSCKGIQGNIKADIYNSKLSRINSFKDIIVHSENSNLKISDGQSIDVKAINANINLERISNKLKMDTVRGKVSIRETRGDIEIISNNTPYDLQSVNARLIHMNNRHNDINMTGIQADKIRIISFGTKISIDFKDLKNLLYIDGGRHGGGITLKFPPGIHPLYNIKNEYGEIIFNRNEPVNLKNTRVISSLTNTEGKNPQIIITNSYSDIEISPSK